MKPSPLDPGRSRLCLSLLLLLAACGSGEGAPATHDDVPDGLRSTRTLAAPPDLQVGEWWKVEVDPALVGATFETTLVVTEREGSRARIGVSSETFSHHFHVIHVPILGDVDLETFAWRVMWDDFQALRFPLELGRRWSADFHGFLVDAEVTRVDGSRAHITMTGPNQRIELVYDARMGMITDFREEALRLAFRVKDHGFGYQGDVLSMGGVELGFMARGPSESAGHHGAAEPTPDGGQTGAGRTTEVVDVATSGRYGSLSLVGWNRGVEDQPGHYSISAKAPDGTVFDAVFDPEPGAASVLVESFGHDAVQGSWELEFHRAGPAGLLVELFTYSLERVTLR